MWGKRSYLSGRPSRLRETDDGKIIVDFGPILRVGAAAGDVAEDEGRCYGNQSGAEQMPRLPTSVSTTGWEMLREEEMEQGVKGALRVRLFEDTR